MTDTGDGSGRMGQFAKRWLPAILLGLVAFGLWQAAEQRDTDIVSTEEIAYDLELGSPMLSARRIPRTLQVPVVDDRLGTVLRAMIADSPPNACLEVRVDGRAIPPSSRVGAGLVPASNQKLASTYAALTALGPDFRFVTTVAGDAPIGADGRLDGTLYLVGAGDPFLSTDDWWTQYDEVDARHHTRLEDLADAIVEAGLREVTGGVAGDESLFDTERTVGAWAERLVNAKQSGPLSALTVNEGFNDWPATYVTARQRSVVDQPAVHAASKLTDLLAERGVTITGAPTAATAPPGTVPIAEVVSPPLIDLVTHVNTYSSNLGAELLLKRLGLERNGIGSTAAGTSAVVEIIDEAGIPTDGLVVDDGSGLAESNRMTCAALSSLLTAAGPGSPFAGTLAIGGERGTLAGRMVDTPAAGSVFAKTGTLQDATALSGYVRSLTDPDVTLVFAYIVNDDFVSTNAAVLGLQDAFAANLTAYPGDPSIDALLPMPAIER